MIESHPFEPWLPGNARLLMLGTFPPAEKRWCMPWYYPNFQNDMWRIFGIIYFDDKFHFVDVEHKTYRLDAIKEFLMQKGVAIYDTAQQVIRTKNTAWTACFVPCLIARRYLLPDSWQPKSSPITSVSGKNRRWEDLWSLNSKTASSVSIVCLAAVGLIRWL